MPRDDEDDETSLERIPRPSRREDSKRHRTISVSDARDLVRAHREALEELSDEQKQERLHLLYAEWFGFDGRGGKLATMESTMRTQGKEIADLKIFKAKVVLLGSLVTMAGGALAAIVMKLIDRLF